MTATGSLFLGEALRTKRLELNISFEAISRKTRIPVNYLKALETENWSAFPAPVYLLGFLRQYADCLGLNSDELVKVYQERLKTKSSQPLVPDTASDHAPLVGTPAPVIRTERLALLLLLLIFLVIYLYKTQRSAPEPQEVLRADALVTDTASILPVATSFDDGVYKLKMRAKRNAYIRVWVDGDLRFEGNINVGALKAWSGSSRFRVQTDNLSLFHMWVNDQVINPQEFKVNGEFRWKPQAAAPAGVGEAPAPQ